MFNPLLLQIHYCLMNYLRWQPYDPSWLVTLARTQHRHEPWLADALARCTHDTWSSRAQLYFVRPDHPTSLGRTGNV
jgi:hypothetical protein